MWQLDRLPEARDDLDGVAAVEPDRPGLMILRCLARSALGERPAPDPASLTSAEANTLRWIERMANDQAPEPGTGQVELVGYVPELWQALADMQRLPDAAPLAPPPPAHRSSGR